jgi:hypothetical protein
MAYHDATFKQWAILAPCFVIGLAGALFLPSQMLAATQF